MDRKSFASGSAFIGYGAAVLLATLAILLRIPFEEVDGGSPAVVLSSLAAAISASIGGLGPGLAATALSLVAEPLTRPVAGGVMWSRLAVLLASGVILTVLVDRSRRLQQVRQEHLARLEGSLREARGADDELRTRVAYLDHAAAAREGFIRKRESAWRHDRRRRREAELLAQLIEQLHRLLDVERMLHPLGAVVQDLMAADCVRIALRESGKPGFRVRYALGDPERITDYAVIRPDAPPVAFVVSTGEVFRTDAVREDARGGSRPDELLLPNDTGGVMVAPIPIGGSTEGLIVAARRSPAGFDLQDELVLRQLGQASAVAIRNAELLAGEQSARAAAEASSRAKDEFLAMLGHELRNPLGAISNAVSGFGRIGDQWAQLHHIMRRQTGHLARLLDDLLDVSRLTVGKIGLQRRAVDLYRVVEEVVGGLEHEAKSASQDLSVSGSAVWVSADTARLEQIVRNLLDNALKYTPPGGKIGLTVALEENDAVLRVRDSGIGIRPEMVQRIFEPFVQQPQTLERSHGGLGLGLTVVRRLVSLHGGTVSASSAGPGGGSEFVVRLPAAPAPELPAGEKPEPVTVTAPGRRCHVAVVEDYADARDALQTLLTVEGHTVSTAADGPAGLELILASQPDVALIDIGLPGLDGYDVARRIRAAPGGGRLYLVALTGYGQAYDRARALDAGFDDHLVKPLDLEALTAVLSRAAA